MSDVLDFGLNFKSVPERLDGEREERIARSKKILPFGVSFLDDALGGIFPNDLIVIGARTGVGKTELCTFIAHNMVKTGRHVHYFALEAEDREIERRIKYRELSRLLYQNSVAGKSLGERLNYADWYAGKLEHIISDENDRAINKRVGGELRSLHTYYRGKKFDMDEMSRLFLAIQDQTDMIILDHLHYVDVDDDNENRGVRNIVKRIRDISLGLGKPVIVVAHLRKSDRRMAMLAPDLDDFHGTSDITKIATKCIMLAKAYDQTTAAPHLWPTYMHTPKCRMEGSRTRYAAVVTFNARFAKYEDEYTIGQFTGNMTKFEELKGKDIPFWAQGAFK